MGRSTHRRWFTGRRGLLGLAALWTVLLLPPVGTLLKQSMIGQMLVQANLLLVIGVSTGILLTRAKPRLAGRLRCWRWVLLLVATITLMIWMIPRMLDLAVQSSAVDLVRAVSLSWLAGLPLYLSWRGFGPVMHGLLHVEALATVWRLGWLYLDSPMRLCVQYGLDDQRQLGYALIGLGTVYAIGLGLMALAGDGRPLQASGKRLPP